MAEHETLGQSVEEQAERNNAAAAYRERCRKAQQVYDRVVEDAWRIYQHQQREIDLRYPK